MQRCRLLGMAVAHLSRFTDKKQYTALDILEAVGHFKHAIEIDPAYAMAYAALADAHLQFGNPVWGGHSPKETLSDAKEAATKAAPFDYMAQAKPAIDMVVRTTDHAPGASTGWHTHPGPVFITVTQGEVTFYEVDDPTCSPTVVKAREGYVDTGHGHIGRNETGNPAKDVAVVIAPVGAPFRSELPAPGPYCAF